MNLGFTEILVIVLAILILFGPKRIPELSRAIGRGIREFRKAMHELQGQLDEQTRPLRDEAASLQRDLRPAESETSHPSDEGDDA